MAERGLRLRAPAKLNWMLEVLARRDDGYHDVRTVLQTLALSDTVTIARYPKIALRMAGAGADVLGPPETNLAWRAADLLRRRCGLTAGASIEIEKRIPVAAGLGGGSSDAAAVLRGLSRLWALDLPPEAMAALAAELGSDVPFFLHGGTALAEGRGERVTPLPDAPPYDIVMLPAGGGEGKTARLFAMLAPAGFDDGAASAALAAALDEGSVPACADLDARYVNTFERVAAAAYEGLAARRDALAAATGRPPRLAGAGPTLYAVVAAGAPLPPGAIRTRTLSRQEALAVELLDG